MNISRNIIGWWIYPGIWLVDEYIKEYDWLMTLSRNKIGSWIYLGILLFDKYVILGIWLVECQLWRYCEVTIRKGERST